MKTRVSLREHTTFAIGGQARFWYEPKTRDELARFLKRGSFDLPLFVIGKGSNLLVQEGLIEKIFIHLSGPDFTRVTIFGKKVRVGAGVGIGRLISLLHSKNLGGYEFLSGIPGTIGGALAMNAGAKNDARDTSSYREIKDIVSWVEVLDRQGNIRRLPRKDINFSYRSSSLRSYIVVAAEFELSQADKKKVSRRIRNNLLERIRSQDWRYPSAGSFFKNPKKGKPAGKLIDLCGLKGTKVGGAQVSDKHANFIVNVQEASSRDVLKLMEIVRKKVYNRFRLHLEPEVEIVR